MELIYINYRTNESEMKQWWHSNHSCHRVNPLVCHEVHDFEVKQTKESEIKEVIAVSAEYSEHKASVQNRGPKEISQML